MSDLIREASLGQILRFLTRNKTLQYPEANPDFELSEAYRAAILGEKPLIPASGSSFSSTSLASPDVEKDNPSPPNKDLEAATTTAALTKSHTATPTEQERLQLETQLALQRTTTTPIAPQRTSDDHILVF